MPNHIKNKIELFGDIQDINDMLNKFGTEVPAKISMTHDGKEAICKSTGADWSVCWMDLKTGRCKSRGEIDQFGLPDGYEIEIKQGFFAFPDFEKVIPPPKDDPAYNDKPTQEIAKQSPNWWYEWNIKNWGTKWCSYSCERESLTVFTFETAWNSVHRIIEVMSEAFPSVTINYSWADEDTGHNCGKSVYIGGSAVSLDTPEGGSKGAYEIAFKLRPDCAKDYELINGKYHYKEE